MIISLFKSLSKKTLFLIILGVFFVGAGIFTAVGVNNRGNAPVAWWRMDEGTGQTTYDSAGSNNGTLGASTSDTSPDPTWKNEDDCKTGKCLQFDGTDDYVNAGSGSSLNPGTNDITITAWVKRGATLGTLQRVFSNRSASVQWYELYFNTDNTLHGSIAINYPTIMYQEFVSSAITDNNWHFVTAVFDRDGNGTIYIDGKISGSPSTIANNVGSLNPSSARIGSFSTSWFKGLIDDVRIYDYARSAAQIKADYVASAGGKGGGVKVGSAQEKRAASEGLIAYWKFDETALNACGTANDACDASGGANHLSALGDAAPTSTAKFGYGATFDGTGDYYCTDTDNNGTCDDDNDLDTTSVITIEAWVKLNALGNYFVSKWDYGASQRSYEIGTTGGGTLIAYISKDGTYTAGTTGFEVTGSTLSTGTWYHVALAADASSNSLRLYLNGNQDGSTVDADFTAIHSGTASMLVGACLNNGTAAVLLNGQVDDVKVYKTVRSAEQIRQDYESGPSPVAHWRLDENTGTTAYDTSGSNNGTLGGGTAAYRPTWANGKFGSALNFDGSDDYVEVTDSGTSPLDIVGGITISAWVKHSATGVYDGIVQKGSFSNNYGNYAFWIGNTETLRFALNNNAANVISTNTIGSGWTHVAATYDKTAGKMKLYINGIKEANETSYSTAISTDDNPLRIGMYYASTFAFGGFIDDVRIYNYSRTQKQILEDMQAGHPAVGSPVGSYAGYWKFDEGYSTTAYDQSINQNNLTLSTSTAWSTNGKFGNAFEGDGSTIYASRADDGDFDFNDAFTISAWAKPDNTDIDGRVVYRYDATSKDGYYLGQSSTGNGAWQFVVFVNPTYKIILSNSPPTGNWQHIVGVRESDGTMKLYVDGVLQSNTDTLTGAIDSSGILYIGQDFAGLYRFDGLIDEVKIYPLALSPEEIKQEYNQGASLALGAKSTASDGATADNSASREYCVPGDTTSCSAPVAHWRMDEKTGQYTYDVAGANDGTLGSGATADAYDPTWKSAGQCHTGSCLSFDGSNDYVNCGNGTSLNIDGSLTVSAWIKPTNYTTFNQIVDKRSGTVNYHFRMNTTSGTLVFAISDGTNTPYITSSNAVSTSAWSYVVAIRDTTADQLKLYINGVQAATPVTDTTTGTIITSADVAIGRRGDGANYFNGPIDDVRIYNYARTQAQIAWDYNRGKPVGWWKMDEGQDTATTCDATSTSVYDYSGNSNTGTLTLGASPSVATARVEGKYSCGINFDGTDDYVSMGDVSSLEFTSASYFTINAWVNAASASEDGYIAGKLGWTTTEGYALYWQGSTDKIAISLNATITGNTSDAVFTDNNTWAMATVVFSAGSVQFYRNGQPAGTLSSKTFTTPGTVAAMIGDRDGTGQGAATRFSGLIDDVRIYNYARTPAQIKQDYNEGAAVRFGPVEGLP